MRKSPATPRSGAGRAPERKAKGVPRNDRPSVNTEEVTQENRRRWRERNAPIASRLVLIDTLGEHDQRHQPGIVGEVVPDLVVLAGGQAPLELGTADAETLAYQIVEQRPRLFFGEVLDSLIDLGIDDV